MEKSIALNESKALTVRLLLRCHGVRQAQSQASQPWWRPAAARPASLMPLRARQSRRRAWAGPQLPCAAQCTPAPTPTARAAVGGTVCPAQAPRTAQPQRAQRRKAAAQPQRGSPPDAGPRAREKEGAARGPGRAQREPLRGPGPARRDAHCGACCPSPPLLENRREAGGASGPAGQLPGHGARTRSLQATWAALYPSLHRGR
jgi:hypothetical protein